MSWTNTAMPLFSWTLLYLMEHFWLKYSPVKLVCWRLCPTFACKLSMNCKIWLLWVRIFRKSPMKEHGNPHQWIGGHDSFAIGILLLRFESKDLDCHTWSLSSCFCQINYSFSLIFVFSFNFILYFVFVLFLLVYFLSHFFYFLLFCLLIVLVSRQCILSLFLLW